MTTELPNYYFRTRDNGAMVFRVDTQNKHQRVEIEQIAVVNINKGDVKPHANQVLSDQDRSAIRSWMESRQALLAGRLLDDMHRTIDQMNNMTQWAQAKASDADLEEITDATLLALHDLRSVLIRKKADRLSKGRDDLT